MQIHKVTINHKAKKFSSEIPTVRRISLTKESVVFLHKSKQCVTNYYTKIRCDSILIDSEQGSINLSLNESMAILIKQQHKRTFQILTFFLTTSVKNIMY